MGADVVYHENLLAVLSSFLKYGSETYQSPDAFYRIKWYYSEPTLLQVKITIIQIECLSFPTFLTTCFRANLGQSGAIKILIYDFILILFDFKMYKFVGNQVQDFKIKLI